jgi:hypothetical protein
MRPIMRHGDHVIMIGVTVMEVVKAVEVGKAGVDVRAVDKSTSRKTNVHPVSPHLTCNCGGADINSTYH